MEPGERVGRYVIEALLGEGGMGEVYRAYDDVLRRRVAIKLLRTDVGDPSDVTANVRRVLREARMVASLEHPNVVAVYDVGEHAGTSFIVMELIKGRSLRSLVGAGVPVSERLRWLFDAARALAAAHRAGLIHRDIKPENILLREDGVVKVLDFGIAREVSNLIAQSSVARIPVGTSPAAWTGAAREGESAVAGTPAYMAPEQVRGEPLDARVDQFAWGVTAYEILTGHLPWTGDASTVLASVLHQAPAPLDAAALGVAPAVALCIARAMRKAQGERFASMDELLSAIGAPGPESSQNVGALASLPVASSPEVASAPTELASAPTELATRSAGSLARSATEVAPAPGRRGRAVALLAAGVLLAAAGAGWVVMHRARPIVSPAASASAAPAEVAPLAFRPVEAKRLTFDLGCEEYPVLTPDGRTVVFSATIDQVEQVVALDLTSGVRRTLTQGPGAKIAPSLSPDGTRVAYLVRRSEARGVYVMPLDGSAPPRLVRAGGIMRPVWSLDGQALWVSNEAGAARVEVDGGRATREIEPPAESELMRVQELADGDAVAIALAKNHLSTIGLVSYAPGASRPAPPLVAADVEEALAVTRDGAQLLFSKILPTGAVELWHVPTRGGAAASVGDSSVQPTKGLQIVGDRVVWSTCRTQQTLAALRSDPGNSRELHAERLAPPSEWEDAGGASIASDPTAMAILSTRSGKRQPWVIDLTGERPARMIPTGDLAIQNLTASPDGHWIAFIVSGQGVFVAPGDGSAPPRAVTARGTDRNPSFSRDSRTLYFETDGPSGRRAIGAVAVAGEAAQPVRIVLDNAWSPAASPVDGRMIYLEPGSHGSEGLPRILDTATGRSRPLSAALTSGEYIGIAWSPDGARIAVANRLQEVLELDAASGKTLHHYRSGDAVLDGMAYVGKDLIVVLGTFAGDVWTARDASGPSP